MKKIGDVVKKREQKKRCQFKESILSLPRRFRSFFERFMIMSIILTKKLAHVDNKVTKIVSHCFKVYKNETKIKSIFAINVS